MFTLSFHNQKHFLLSQLQTQPLNSLAYTSLCKWVALILTFLTTLLIIRFRHNNTPSIPLIVADYDFSDCEDDDDDNEISSEIEKDEDEDEEEEHKTDAYFRVSSIGDLLSLSEIANTKTVVKLWDSIGFGLGLGFDNFCSSSGGSVVSVYGDNELHGGASPAMVVSAGENASGNLAVGVWDTRLRHRIPAVMAEWGPSIGKTVRVESGEMHKAYVKDDGRYGLTVGDMRNARWPLENVTESHMDFWWPNPFIMRI